MTKTFALTIALLAGSAVAGDWYRWRGPEQTGVSREVGLPDKFALNGENFLWKAPYGGMSSPVVMNGRVYTITRVNEEKATNTLIAGPLTQEAVVCLDAATGAKIWEHHENIFQTTVPFHRLGWTNPAGDPATGRVYMQGVQGTLICLDGKDGKLIWKRQLADEFGMISTFGGRTQTPAIDEDRLLIGGVFFGWGDHARGQARMLAFDKNDGRLIWSTGTGGIPNTVSFNTPIIAMLGGVRQVVWGAGDGSLNGFAARTGKHLWTFKLSKLGINAATVVGNGKVYAVHSEENFDAQALGRVVCVDVSGPTPKEVWRADGIEAGFATPLYHEGRVYVMDNGGKLLAFDAEKGTHIWEKKLGTMGRSSPIMVDGKIYIGEANGRFYVLRPGESKVDIVSMTRMDAKLGREYAIYGSPAVSDGRLIVPCANNLYCFGKKDAAAQPLDPKVGAVDDGAAEGAPVHLQVIPADVVLAPGGKVSFETRAYDAKGRLLPTVKAEWAIGKLTMVLPTGNKEVGTLGGTVDASGTYTAAAGPVQGGAVVATAGALKGAARVRVFSPLPWKIDFTNAPVGTAPLTWIGAGGKFDMRALPDGNICFVKIGRLPDGKLDPRYLPLYDSARTYFGPTYLSDYTMVADTKVDGAAQGDQRTQGDTGLINSRYTLVLLGQHQRLQINVWPAAIPGEKDPNGSLSKSLPFKWEPNVWYRMKLRVEQQTGKAVIRGKVWKATDAEPADWSIEVEDTQPNLNGSPGIFAVSFDANSVYHDNINVTSNK